MFHGGKSLHEATFGALTKKKPKVVAGLWGEEPEPKAPKMWVSKYAKYPQQVKLDVEKYVLSLYSCLWRNQIQMASDNVLCELVINRLQMEQKAHPDISQDDCLYPASKVS